MYNIDRLVATFQETGAKNKTLTAMAAAVNQVYQQTPAVDIDKLINEAVASDLATGDLEDRLNDIAKQRAAGESLDYVRTAARAAADAHLADWAHAHLDEIINQMGEALQPRLDRLAERAGTLPKWVRTDIFPVTAEWTGEQHTTWIEIADEVTFFDRIQSAISWAYAGIGSDQQFPDDWSRWFGWLDLGKVHRDIDTEITGNHRVGEGLTVHTVHRWVALAHVPGLVFKLASPTQAQARAATYAANRSAAKPRPAPVDAQPGVFFGRVGR